MGDPVETEVLDWVTPQQAAEILNIHRTTVFRWMNAGKLKVVFVAGQRMIPRAQVEGMLKTREARPEHV
jgi:excisionase family DNA binding protein